MKKVFLIISVILSLVGGGCKKKNQAPVLKPTATTLFAPAQNSVCTSGIILSGTESSISFSWEAASNTNSYKLIIKNLLTSDSTIKNTTQTQLADTLLRNTPYAWYVISESSKTSATAQSPIWKFYNSGPGVVTYAPFPADITLPTFGQIVSSTTGTVNLTWIGSVVITDAIASYDVYFGTASTPPIVASAITNSYLDNVPISANTTYYWSVTTRDVNGNTSNSGLYQFSVN